MHGRCFRRPAIPGLGGLGYVLDGWRFQPRWWWLHRWRSQRRGRFLCHGRRGWRRGGTLGLETEFYRGFLGGWRRLRSGGGRFGRSGRWLGHRSGLGRDQSGGFLCRCDGKAGFEADHRGGFGCSRRGSGRCRFGWRAASCSRLGRRRCRIGGQPGFQAELGRGFFAHAFGASSFTARAETKRFGEPPISLVTRPPVR